MRFGYYQRLKPRQRAIYRRSDAVTQLPLPDAAALAPAAAALAEALATEDRTTVARAARALSKQLCEALAVRVPTVRVLSRRPSDATHELHGLYEQSEDGKVVIRVWMRTAAHERVVAYRTFLRTLLHELCHHLDYELLKLADSFHTKGFFQRESSLLRQLAPKPAPVAGPSRDRSPPEPKGPRQLGLPGV